MMLETQIFDYVVKNENGEILGKYTSTKEPPMKGDMIDLPWETAEVLGVTMTLTDQGNTVTLKIKPAESPRNAQDLQP